MSEKNLTRFSRFKGTGLQGDTVAQNDQLVYPVGQFGYDFGTEAIRDSFRLIGITNPDKPEDMVGYLRQIYQPYVKGLEDLFNKNCDDAFQVKVEAEKGWPQSPRLEPKAPSEDLPTLDADAPITPMAAAQPPWRLFEDRLEILKKKKLFDNIEARRYLLSAMMYNKPAAGRLIWTLKHDGKPVYAIRPQGPFASETYDLLIQYLLDQTHSGVEWFSIPGKIAGQATLRNRQVVPVIEPEIQGMYSWKPLSHSADDSSKHFLDRILSEVRNPGRMPNDRALNFSATTAFMLVEILNVVDPGKELFSIKVEPLKECRTGSDCWNTKLAFFDPSNIDTPQHIYQVIVDVSDVVPVQIGKFKEWHARYQD